MWQPDRRQWLIICTVTALVVLGWPPDTGRSLGAKLVNWAADPMHALPAMPPALPMGLDDDGDAVTEHDMLETAYQHARQRSNSNRLRMDLKEAADPLERTTQRQLLIGLSVLAALAVWRLDGMRRR